MTLARVYASLALQNRGRWSVDVAGLFARRDSCPWAQAGLLGSGRRFRLLSRVLGKGQEKDTGLCAPTGRYEPSLGAQLPLGSAEAGFFAPPFP